jgi:hypothetical protein
MTEITIDLDEQTIEYLGDLSKQYEMDIEKVVSVILKQFLVLKNEEE